MSQAVTLVLARLKREEGVRTLPYDDATGLQVRAPKGNITWGYGFALEKCGSSRLFDVMELELVSQCEESLLPFAWYAGTDPVRQSVLLDVAYNAGVSNLLHFVNMLAAVLAKDWQRARDELLNSAAARGAPNRYNALAAILLSGNG